METLRNLQGLLQLGLLAMGYTFPEIAISVNRENLFCFENSDIYFGITFKLFLFSFYIPATVFPPTPYPSLLSSPSDKSASHSVLPMGNWTPS